MAAADRRSRAASSSSAASAHRSSRTPRLSAWTVQPHAGARLKRAVTSWGNASLCPRRWAWQRLLLRMTGSIVRWAMRGAQRVAAGPAHTPAQATEHLTRGMCGLPALFHDQGRVRDHKGPFIVASVTPMKSSCPELTVVGAKCKRIADLGAGQPLHRSVVTRPPQRLCYGYLSLTLTRGS